jgi:ElaB/YqjD/DUF883 family membrane-anchored ribosome-binding protein
MSLLSSSAAVTGLKEDARNLAESATEAAREKVVDPALEAARDAVKQTRKFLTQQGKSLERAASDGRDRVSDWVAANPLAALGVAFAAGLLCTALFRANHRD